MFCIGCTGKLPGFAPSGPSALEGVKALSQRSRGAEVGPSSSAEPLLPSETKTFWFQLGALAVLMMIGFLGWFLHMKDKPSDIVRRTTVQTQEPAAQQFATNEDAPPHAPWLPVPAERPLPSESGVAVGSLPDVPAPKVSRPGARPVTKATVVVPSNLSDDPNVQAVEKFYRALSAADGKKAASIVIPAKRGIGPFNETNISRFYGSMQRPLSLRSIRLIDASLLEAKYSYRVSTTTCEGTAIVETQRVSQETLIRSIRANC
jgi:hypothetical protein